MCFHTTIVFCIVRSNFVSDFIKDAMHMLRKSFNIFTRHASLGNYSKSFSWLNFHDYGQEPVSAVEGALYCNWVPVMIPIKKQ